MGKVAAVAAVVLCVGAGCSPYGGGAFTCSTDQQCSKSGTPGTCETTTGFCAFADPGCDSGERYGSLSGSLSNTCVGGGDAGTMIDNPPNLNCYGTGFVNACFVTAPSGPLTLSAPINTDTGSPDCSSLVTNSTDWCVIAAGDITTTGAITATGARPLVLLATGTLQVTGTIDIASHRAGAAIDPGQIGAGAVPVTDTTLCDPGTGPGASGGGAGGSFVTPGAQGGDPMHGAAGGMKTVAALRGGCAGQDGMSGNPGAKGMGGGAIYLYAGTSITIDGPIDASGAAGTHGATGNAGGGGGGAGGMIVLDAPAVTNNGVLYANGGGGAEGSGNTTPGSDGNEPTGTGAAPATVNASNGGDGGGGAAEGVSPGAGGNAIGFGGGGGGGGLGVIKLFQVSSIGGSTSPAPTP